MRNGEWESVQKTELYGEGEMDKETAIDRKSGGVIGREGENCKVEM